MATTKPKPTKRSAPDALMSIADVAERLGVGERMVRRLVLERKLAVTRIGRLIRFDPTDVEAFVAASRSPAVR